MKWYVGYYVRNKNLYTGKIVEADAAEKAIKRARVKNIIELCPLKERIAKDVYAEFDLDSDEEVSKGIGYSILDQYTINEGTDDEVILQVVFDTCLYIDTFDGHKYFGIYSFAEVKGGDAITEYEWSYTDDTELSSLIELLQEISEALSKDELIKAYNNAA